MPFNRNEYSKNYRKTHPEYYERMKKISAEYTKQFRKQLFDEIFMLLGDKCITCGFSDRRALQIDHVNGNGRKERESFKNVWRYYRFVLEQIKNGSKDYQCLCANCNSIKRHKKYENYKGKSSSLISD